MVQSIELYKGLHWDHTHLIIIHSTFCTIPITTTLLMISEGADVMYRNYYLEWEIVKPSGHLENTVLC